MQAFTRITGSICSCLVIGFIFFIQKGLSTLLYYYELIEDTIKERDEGK